MNKTRRSSNEKIGRAQRYFPGPYLYLINCYVCRTLNDTSSANLLVLSYSSVQEEAGTAVEKINSAETLGTKKKERKKFQ